MLKMIPDKPALSISGREKWIVIADLHLGIVHFPDRTVIEDAVSLAESEKADGVIVLGDLKHDIGLRIRERKEVELFKNSLLNLGIEEDKIILLRGNHDSGLDDLIRIEPSSGMVFGEYGFFHGHAKPSAEVLQSKFLVFAHIHPAIFISDTIGGVKRRVWLEGEWVEGEIEGGESKDIKNVKKVLVMPAFNELCSSIAVNMDKKITNRYKLWNFSAVMLDGTRLGRVGDLWSI
jgi:hypothetical protein